MATDGNKPDAGLPSGVEIEKYPALQPMPKYLSGTGGLPFWQINEAFDRLTDLDQQSMTSQDLRPMREPLFARLESTLRFLFPGEVRANQDGGAEPPLTRELSWHEVRYHSGDQELSHQIGSRRSDLPNIGEFGSVAFLMPPPFGFMYATAESDGSERHFWQPGTMAYACRVFEVFGPPTQRQYQVQTVDQSILTDPLTPIDRWEGVNYVSKQTDDPMLLFVTGSEFDTDLHLLAFETPVFAMCPPPGGSPAGGGAQLASFIGL